MNTRVAGRRPWRRIVTVFSVLFAAIVCGNVAVPAGAAPSDAAPGFTFGEATSLSEVLNVVRKLTTADVHVAAADQALADSYRFPGRLKGVALPMASAPDALDFVCGAGWEGSPLVPEDRDRAGTNFQLRRAPYTPQGSADFPCNNQQWRWVWRKAADTPPGGEIIISSALQDDGDIAVTAKFKLGVIRPDMTLATLLDLVRERTGIVVNIEGQQYVPVTLLPDSVRPQMSVPGAVVPMVAQEIPAHDQATLAGPVTIGQVLTALVRGLNVHCAKTGGLWRWSSARGEGDGAATVYTLRDYAHFSPPPPKKPAKSRAAVAPHAQ